MPSGATTPANPFFFGTSCPTTGTCVSVGGYFDTSNSEQGLIETQSGGTWSALEAPLPSNATTTPGAQYVSLDDISCPTTGVCAAIGTYYDASGNEQGVIETLSGGTWSAIEAPLPSNAASNAGIAVSGDAKIVCSSAGACVAVSYYSDTSGSTHGLIETLSGGTWSALEAPLPSNAATNPGQQTAGLYPVSCDSAGSCVAVGAYTDTSGIIQGLIETLSGGTWSALEAPLPSNAASSGGSGTDLQSVSCPSTGTCAVSGFYTDSSVTTQGLLETLSGGTWSALEAPLPSNGSLGVSEMYSNSLSCPAAGTCVAIGQYNASGTLQGLIETLSGGTWSAAEEPLPSGATGISAGGGSFINSFVTCTSVDACVAIGQYNDTAGSLQGLIETLSGGTWNASEAPLPSNAADPQQSPGTDLLSAACSSTDNCVALGYYADNSGGSSGFIESIGPSSGFQITTTSLPNATPGAKYGPVTLTTQNVAVSTSPYVTSLKWKKVSLPKGLKLSKTGVLSGTPGKKLTGGLSSVKVQVTETVTTRHGKKKVKTKTTVQATIPLTIT